MLDDPWKIAGRAAHYAKIRQRNASLERLMRAEKAAKRHGDGARVKAARKARKRLRAFS